MAGAPAAPLARTRSVSLVEVSPSTLMALNVRAVTSRSVLCNNDGETFASVATKASVVAMFGWIMPAPLAQPMRWMRFPDMRNEAEAVLGRVSAVQMARERLAQERAEGRRVRAGMGKARA